MDKSIRRELDKLFDAFLSPEAVQLSLTASARAKLVALEANFTNTADCLILVKHEGSSWVSEEGVTNTKGPALNIEYRSREQAQRLPLWISADEIELLCVQIQLYPMLHRKSLDYNGEIWCLI